MKGGFNMGQEGKEKNPEYKKITIRTIDGSTIHGKVNVSPEDRVSDLFTTKEALFIVLVDVTSSDHTNKTLFINKNHIVWVEPED